MVARTKFRKQRGGGNHLPTKLPTKISRIAQYGTSAKAGIVSAGRGIRNATYTTGRGIETGAKYGVKGLGAIALTPFALTKGAISGTIATGRTGLKATKKIITKSPSLMYRGLRQGLTGVRLALTERKLRKMQSKGQNTSNYEKKVQAIRNSYARKKARSMKILTNAAASIKKTAVNSYGKTAQGFLSTYTGKKGNRTLDIFQRLKTGTGITRDIMPKTLRPLKGYTKESNTQAATVVSAPGKITRTSRAIGSALRISRGTQSQLKQLEQDTKSLSNLQTEYGEFKTKYTSPPQYGNPEYGNYLLQKQYFKDKLNALTTSTQEIANRLRAKGTAQSEDVLKEKYRITVFQGKNFEEKFIEFIKKQKSKIGSLNITKQRAKMDEINKMVSDLYSYHANKKINNLNTLSSTLNQMREDVGATTQTTPPVRAPNPG